MKNLFKLLPLLLLCGCFSASKVMTYNDYEAIEIGENICTVEQNNGQPYSIHKRGHNKEEYEYIERIDLGNGLVYENHYFLTVDGEFISKKRFKQERPPSYDFIYSDDPNVFNNF